MTQFYVIMVDQTVKPPIDWSKYIQSTQGRLALTRLFFVNPDFKTKAVINYIKELISDGYTHLLELDKHERSIFAKLLKEAVGESGHESEYEETMRVLFNEVLADVEAERVQWARDVAKYGDPDDRYEEQPLC